MSLERQQFVPSWTKEWKKKLRKNGGRDIAEDEINLAAWKDGHTIASTAIEL